MVGGFADRPEQIIVAELDRVAPVGHSRRQPSKPITRWLSQAAITTKHERRRLERRWQRTKLDVDFVAYRRACRHTNKRFKM